MIKTCRDVLKNLRKLSYCTEDTLSFLGNTDCICRYDDLDKVYNYSKYKGEISSIIEQLASDGYIKYSINECTFTLTQKGLHPHRFEWEAVKHFLLTSVLVPIVVSIITTLLTLFVEGLLSGK